MSNDWWYGYIVGLVVGCCLIYFIVVLPLASR